VREIPDDAVNLDAPAGTPAASAAEFAPIWCSHGVKWEWQPEVGGYLPMVLEVDALHSDIPAKEIKAMPDQCRVDVTGFDPAEFPNAGPAAVDRMRAEVLREHPELR
jgi:hypothetical protein